jgi:hypothetical protein
VATAVSDAVCCDHCWWYRVAGRGDCIVRM